ncbi:hypothetical protein KEM56_007050 [Ascosphaera pollenicola]|nr:hypothetical protein KEM56_007050 [Ascosphaera pollenicola]
MARLNPLANQNPFEQLAHTESLDSDPESDHEIDSEEEDEAEETIDETTTTTTTTEEEIHIEEGGFTGDSIFRSAQRESIRQHVSDDVLSISSLSTEVVDASQAIAAPPKRNALGPIPDLRFEQGYLRSISDARTWQKVLWITVRDQPKFTRRRRADIPESVLRQARQELAKTPCRAVTAK